MEQESDIRRQPRKATVVEVAHLAGVSIGTVSGVLKGKEKERRISEEVARRVRQAAIELDYSPNLLIQSLRHGSTGIVSFFNGFRRRDRDDFWMDALSTGLERKGGQSGYNILIYCDFEADPKATYRYLNGGNNDGLVFLKPMDNDPLLPHLRNSSLPVVLLNCVDEANRLSSVVDDWRSGMHIVADRLLALHHTRIAVLYGEGLEDSLNRMRALEALLGLHDVTVPDHWRIAVDAKQPSQCRAALEHVMKGGEPPTALFCWHDYLGYRILEQCEALGLSVPEELSVVGYDGIHWPARTRHILASVSSNAERLGEAAVEVLDDLIKGRQTRVERMLPVTFDAGTTLAEACR